jgi:two-component system OmpR family sensor kinase
VRTPGRLDRRLALAVLLGFAASGIALVAWQSQVSRTESDAQWQAQSLDLARYVVQRHAQRLADGAAARRPDALADIGMYITLIHPSLEAYLITAEGVIVSHTLPEPGPARPHIDLAPVRALLAERDAAAEARAVQLPIYGEDPRVAQGRNLVSVAPLGSDAWLYLVLRGKQASQVAAQGEGRVWQAAGIAVLGMALLLGVGTTVAMQRQVTRRLMQLAAELARFRVTDGTAPAEPMAGDEIDQLRADAQALQDRVEQQFRQLEDSDRQRRELISNISHDLHTPLANVRGWLDTLLISGERLSPQERERHLQTAARHCAGLGRRVAELFELASLDSARAVAHPEAFCVADLLSDVVQAHQLGAEQAGIVLRLSPQADLGVEVVADVALIERVLNNLVDNALRHTARGGQIELNVCSQGQSVMVRVADNGCGIAQADLPHVFERYWTTRHVGPARPDAQAPAPHHPGVSAGLGLAIARRIVELHGGKISVVSREQAGSEFSFWLPMHLHPA